MRREPGLDLLRSLGLLAVVSFHFFLYNGFYYQVQKGLSMYLANCALTLSISCNGVFLMLTGYLKCEKKPSAAYYRGVIPLLFSYVLAAVANLAFRTFYLGEALTVRNWIFGLLDCSGAHYGWYVEMYLGLFLLAPVMNLALSQLHTCRQFLWLIGTMVLVALLPSDSAHLPDFWVSLYPLAYYCVGAAIRKFRPVLRTVWCLVGVAALAALIGGVTYLTANGGTYRDGYNPVWGSLCILVQTTLLFLAFYRLRFPRILCKLFRSVAAVSFESYLLSYLFDQIVYRLLPHLRRPGCYSLAYCTMALPIFLLSCLAGSLLYGIRRLVFRRAARRSSEQVSV